MRRWVHCLNLDKWFQRYLNFSAPQRGFLSNNLEGNYLSEMAPNIRFLKSSLQFSGTHNFVKNNPKFENKGLYDAKFYGASHEKIFSSQSSVTFGSGSGA